MKDFDAIIVGAGPGGSAAAYDLAAAGADVLLLDRKEFPRLKPCAGALTIKAIKRLRFSVAPVIKWVARDLEVSLGGQHFRQFRSNEPIAVMTVRQEFDAYCLAQTIRRGVTFRKVPDIKSLEEDAEGVSVVITDGETLRARYIIGADGVRSRVRRLIGMDQPLQALAVEGTIPIENYQGAMRFDFGYTPGGYGWVFPKSDHINVGLYTQKSGQAISKSDVVTYAKQITGLDGVEHLIGYPIGIGGETRTPRQGKVLLVGDAAGLTDRLLGEGIHNAIKSGQIAAESIIAAMGGRTRKTYGLRLRELNSDLTTCSTAAKWFYGIQNLGFGALVSHPARTSLMRGFAAGLTFREIVTTCWRAPFWRVENVPSIIEFERSGNIHKHAKPLDHADIHL